MTRRRPLETGLGSHLGAALRAALGADKNGPATARKSLHTRSFPGGFQTRQRVDR